MKKLLVALMVILSTGAMAQQKIGHVNSQKLLDTLPSRKVAMKTLKDFEESGTKELMEMEDDLNKSYAIYMEKEKSLAPIMQKIEQEKLQKKQAEGKSIRMDSFDEGIFEDKAIVMDIPVHTVGASKGVMNGGNLRRPYRKLRVKAIPSKLPDFIEVDITPLKIGSKHKRRHLNFQLIKWKKYPMKIVYQLPVE